METPGERDIKQQIRKDIPYYFYKGAYKTKQINKLLLQQIGGQNSTRNSTVTVNLSKTQNIIKTQIKIKIVGEIRKSITKIETKNSTRKQKQTRGDGTS